MTHHYREDDPVSMKTQNKTKEKQKDIVDERLKALEEQVEELKRTVRHLSAKDVLLR